MKSILVLLALFASHVFAAGPVLIVADEFPAMETLAAKLKAAEGIDSKIVKQAGMPADLASYPVMIVYIHGDLSDAAEKKFIEFTKAGGRLLLLHHSISSGKRRNQYWTPFVGVQLPWGDFASGGYRWVDPVTLQIVNLAPKDYVTTHEVNYDEKIVYQGGRELPGFTLHETEVYLNHIFTGPRKVLLGFKYTDAATGKVYMQDRAGWYMRSGKGSIFYFMPGHAVREFEHPAYSRIVMNAVTVKLP